MIVTKKRNATIIMQQLKIMGLSQHTKQYFIRETTPATKDTPADNHHFVLSSIKFP